MVILPVKKHETINWIGIGNSIPVPIRGLILTTVWYMTYGLALECRQFIREGFAFKYSCEFRNGSCSHGTQLVQWQCH